MTVVGVAIAALVVDIESGRETGSSSLQAVTLAIGAISALFAAMKFPIELSHNREQREREHTWRVADKAKSLNDEMFEDPLVEAAFEMLDYPGGTVTLDDKTKIEVSDAEIEDALKTAYEPKDKVRQIRRCLDSLFFYMALMQHYADQKLIRLEDVAYPLGYYVSVMSERRKLYEEYFEFYGLYEARACFDWMARTHHANRKKLTVTSAG